MFQTGVMIAAILLAVTFALFSFSRSSLRQRKVDQKIERALRDMMVTEAMLEKYRDARGGYPEPEDNALPADFVRFHAEQLGNKPLNHEEARLGRLDLFSPDRAHSLPLRYLLHEDRWILISRGPDEEFNIEPALLGGDEQAVQLRVMAYDPTNGAASAGDLWMSNIR